MSVGASGLELVGVPVVGHTTPTESTILWAVKGPSTSWVEYGETADLGLRADRDEDGLRSYDAVMHRVTLTGLTPGARYFYRAHTRAIDFRDVYSIIPGETLVSEIGSFTTLDPDAAETSFIIWNDTHDDKETIVGLHQLSTQTPHDFLFLNGDVSDFVDDEADMVGLYINPHGQPFAQNAPLLFARGNHDVRGRAARNLARYVAVPDGRFYYAFRQGPMAAIVLDTGEDKPDEHPIFGGLNSFEAYRTRQRLWLEEEIQKPEFYLAPFRILFCHIPLWCRDGDEDSTCQDGLTKWHALLEKAKIHAIVSGHTHESVVLPPTKAHSYYQIIGGGPRVETATLIRAHASRQQMTFTIRNLNGETLNEVVLKASDQTTETLPQDAHSTVDEHENPLARDVFLPLLREWIGLCERHDVQYSIFWGTLLGQLRDQRIIPYDLDIDVVVGKSGLNALYALPGRAPGCVFNDELKDQPAWKDREVRLVVRKDLISPDGLRYNHLGQLTPTQTDSCAFNGPLARLIVKLPANADGREYWHLDVDMFTDITRFNPYPAINEVEELPELELRLLEGIQVSCLKYPLPYIEGYYGSDFMTPDHVYRDGKWVPRRKRRFTVGIVTCDDFDGVHSTVQALRMYHPEIADQTEIIVIDNNPGGPCSEPLRSLGDSIPGYRYIPNSEIKGAAVCDLIFREACGECVLCVDCNVLIVPGAVKRLYDYFDAHPDCNDLLQGPMLCDDAKTMATHLHPEWEAGTYGRWSTVNDDEAPGIDDEPFEIPMQSLGLFACRRAAWPGINPDFRGLGSAEGYLHEKVRRRGGRAICLPFLRWLLQSNRSPADCAPVSWDDPIWNYIVGRRELDLSTKDVREHFAEFLGAGDADRIIAQVEAELPPAYRLDVNPYQGELRVHHGSGDVFSPIWDEASLNQQRHLLKRICDVARSLEIKLYLYWGSLLGHIRESGILPWDDDVDIALFDAGALPDLNDALRAEGLQVWDMKSHVKICDRSYRRTSRLQFTWPAVDIFSYSLDPDDIAQQAEASNQPPHYVLPQRDFILPGRPVEFEGAKLWQPERPLAILDKHYEGWRDFEETSSWSHVKEGPFRQWFRRPIVTDAAGHKVAVAHGPPAPAGP